ncbi:MAG: serine hydrolase domain-containing protein [Gemmatimonadota bacterium]
MPRWIALALALFAAPLPLAAQTAGIPRAAAVQPIAPPDTPVGKRLGEVLAVFATFTPAAGRGLVEKVFAPRMRDAFSMEEHLRRMGQMAGESGGFDLFAVEVVSPTELRATLRSRGDGRWMGMTLRTEAEPPHLLAGLGLRPGRPPEALREPPAASPAEAAARLKTYVEGLAAADRFSGVVLVADGANVLLHEAYGEAEKSFHAPNTPDTKFNLGSMNKMFTAVAILQLMEQGRLALDDPIGKYLGAEWIRPAVGSQVQVQHLLSHTAGLGSYFTDAFMSSSRTRFRAIDDYQPIVRGDSLAFAPGAQWRYSNTGFLLLGAIVEQVTGGSYYDYVRDHVFTPAGMTDTDSYAMDEVTPNLAIGYERAGEGAGGGVRWRNNILEHVVRGGPAGGGYSTAPDLLRFAHALREHRLLSPETTRLMTTPKPALNSPEYGFGFGFWDGGRVVGHTGGFPGISAVLQIGLDRPETVIVLSNYGQASMPVVQKAGELVAIGD